MHAFIILSICSVAFVPNLFIISFETSLGPIAFPLGASVIISFNSSMLISCSTPSYQLLFISSLGSYLTFQPSHVSLFFGLYFVHFLKCSFISCLISFGSIVLWFSCVMLFNITGALCLPSILSIIFFVLLEKLLNLFCMFFSILCLCAMLFSSFLAL